MISDLRANLYQQALSLGFAAIGITQAKLPDSVACHLSAYLDQGHHGDMAWMAETFERRVSPDAMWREAQSAIVLAMNYGQGLDNFARLDEKSTGVISTYALNGDYHDIIKSKLKNLATWFAKASGANVKVFVDTAPLMEKPLAALAGLGWQGKHTNLVSRQLGSWFFLGVILTDLKLPMDQPETDHCGTCQACLDICPTQAFTAPHQIDARRCVSYLTIEHKGQIPEEFRKAIGNRIYGCDDCLAACPWNKFASAAHEIKLKAREELIKPSLTELLKLDDAGFRKFFSRSPVKRIGRDRFIRNCLVAAGNSGDRSLISLVEKLQSDQSPLVSDMAIWALGELCQ